MGQYVESESGRRAFLSGAVSSVIFGTAGCMGLVNPNDTVRIGKAVVANRDSSSSHSIRVVVSDTDAVVHEETYELPPATDSVAPSTDFTEQIPDKAGEYVVEGYLDESSDPEIMNVAETSPSECTFVNVISESSSELSLLYSDGCNGTTRTSNSSEEILR